METLDKLRTGPARRPLESYEPRKLWLLGITLESDGTLTGPGLRRYSFWAECECPADCNRDHENE